MYACIAPHGSEAIEELASKATQRKFLKTHDGLLKLGRELGQAKPDTIVIATPHNLKLWKKIGIVLTENCTGVLQASPRNKKSVNLKAKCDVEFAKELLERSTKKQLPVVGANFGTSEGLTSDMPMDWGTLVPLWFMIPRCRKKPKIVVVTPSREMLLARNFEFGRIIAQQAEAQRRKRVAFVASADQAHTHRKTGPYGFSRRAKDYDRIVLEAVSKNRLRSIMTIRRDLVEAAKPDSLWQMAILAGILEEVSLKAKIVSYEAPTYFGMICASFHPIS